MDVLPQQHPKSTDRAWQDEDDTDSVTSSLSERGSDEEGDDMDTDSEVEVRLAAVPHWVGENSECTSSHSQSGWMNKGEEDSDATSSEGADLRDAARLAHVLATYETPQGAKQHVSLFQSFT